MEQKTEASQAVERRAEYEAFCEWVRETPSKPFSDMAWEAWKDGRARLRAALKARPAPTEAAQGEQLSGNSGELQPSGNTGEAAQGEYSFSKPKGWINLANPGQSWEQWTKAQGIPTTRGWKISAQGEDSARLDAEPGPWVVLVEDADIDYTRLLDVVLSNGVYLMGCKWGELDWTQVRDWRYSGARASAETGGVKP